MKKQEMHLGQEVTNLGQHAIVWGFHEITGDPILRDADGNKWLADAAKCKPCSGWRHKDGLVELG